MKRIDSNLQCPSCSGALRPKILVCDPCGIQVEGPFQMNEFSALSPEDLHFLRIFVLSEGRIRDMEGALGLSYPTIRSRLTDLKNRLMSAGGAEAVAAAPLRAEDTSARGVLESLERGEISFEDAMKKIRKGRGRAMPGNASKEKKEGK